MSQASLSSSLADLNNRNVLGIDAYTSVWIVRRSDGHGVPRIPLGRFIASVIGWRPSRSLKEYRPNSALMELC